MLKEKLAARNISAAELARRIGYSERMVHYYLSGQWPMRLSVARLISLSTGIKLNEVLDGDGREHDETDASHPTG
jgi:transcriptional regulator with XRE-family HTH domain